MSYTAIIPARSGSKRLPSKNVKMLAGKPLLVWTVEACINSKQVDKVIFSTDSKEYWGLLQQYVSSDKLCLDFRSPDEAGDNIKIFDYLKGSVDKIFGETKGKFMLCLPTMPLRTEEHITEAIELCEHSGKPVFSAVEYDFAVSFAFSISADQAWHPLFENSPMLTGNTRSQDQTTAYHPNGAIYIREIDSLRDSTLSTLYEGGVPYVMEKTQSVDIDTDQDFRIAELMMLC